MKTFKENLDLRVTLLVGILFMLSSCVSTPHLNPDKVRPWSDALEIEYPQQKVVIAHYHRGEYDLYDLAARHTSDAGSDTMRSVRKLFNQFQFKALLIESIPYSSGESPQWFLKEAKKGITPTFIPGEESALGVILAEQHHIPFFAGEPDHKDIYLGLRAHGYTDLDVIGFYVVRQIPQWVREKEVKSDILKKKAPPFIKTNCKIFGLSYCPSMDEVLGWYKSKLDRDLTVDVSNEEVAPILGGRLFTQKVSSDVGLIRDHFTLDVIENLLLKYKQVAIIYGAGHYVTLRKSFDAALGEPTFTEDHDQN